MHSVISPAYLNLIGSHVALSKHYRRPSWNPRSSLPYSLYSSDIRRSVNSWSMLRPPLEPACASFRIWSVLRLIRSRMIEASNFSKLQTDTSIVVATRSVSFSWRLGRWQTSSSNQAPFPFLIFCSTIQTGRQLHIDQLLVSLQLWCCSGADRQTIFQNMIQAPNLAQILLGGYFFGKIRWPP